jgi:hypothetical protein
MHHDTAARQSVFAALDAQRAAAELNSRPQVEETPQLLDLAMSAMSSAELDRAAGRYADARMNEDKARAYARRWRELNH